MSQVIETVERLIVRSWIRFLLIVICGLLQSGLTFWAFQPRVYLVVQLFCLTVYLKCLFFSEKKSKAIYVVCWALCLWLVHEFRQLDLLVQGARPSWLVHVLISSIPLILHRTLQRLFQLRKLPPKHLYWISLATGLATLFVSLIMGEFGRWVSFGLLVIIVIGFSYVFMYLQPVNPKELEILEARIHELDTWRRKHRYWLHDYHHHAHVKETLYEEEAKRYDLASRFAGPLPPLSRSVLEIFIKRCHERAKKNGVDFEFDYDDVIEQELSPVDVVSLFGNLFDNALKAALKSKTPWVKGRAKSHHGTIIIIFENSTQDVVFINNRPKSTGHGLKIIEGIVARYQGMIDYQSTDGKFVVEILLFPV